MFFKKPLKASKNRFFIPSLSMLESRIVPATYTDVYKRQLYVRQL